MVIIETSAFTRRVLELMADEEYRKLQLALINRPDLGSVITGGGGLRKIRWAVPGKGKRGGVRVIYYWAVAQEQLLLLFLFAKNERAELSRAQLKMLKKVVEDQYP